MSDSKTKVKGLKPLDVLNWTSEDYAKWYAEGDVAGSRNVALLTGWLLEQGGWQDEDGEWLFPDDLPNTDGAMSMPYKHTANDKTIELCRKYLCKVPVSVSGSNGHDAAWNAANVIVKGFCIPSPMDFELLKEFSARCQPPWSDKELHHKLDSVRKTSNRPDGYVINRHGRSQFQQQQQQPQAVSYYYPPQQEDEDFVVFPKKDPPDVFPIEVFPPALRRFADEISASLDCPVDFAAIPILVVAGAVLGNSRALQIKDGWHESGRMYVAVVAHPGSAKSPAENIVKAPLVRLQIERSARWKDEKDIWESHKQNYDAALKRQSHQAAMPANPGKCPAEPHLFTTDATIEVLHPILQSNPRGICFLCDEFAAWLGGMNQYKGGNGRDRQFWLSAWSGETSKIDRKGTIDQGSIIVPRPFVSVMGGIQPDKVKELCNDAANDGFMDRILFSFPVTSHGAPWNNRTVSHEAKWTWSKIINWIASLEMNEADSSNPEPRIVNFTETGRRIWEQWANTHQAELRQPDFDEGFIGIWSKLRAYAGRLALVIHFLRLATFAHTGEFDNDSQPGDLTYDPEQLGGEDGRTERVDALSMVCASALIDYFKTHIKRVYDRIGVTKQDETAEKLEKWAVNRGGSCTVREIVQCRFAKKASQARDLIKDMADRGRAKIIWKPGSDKIIQGMEIKVVAEDGEKPATP